MTRLTHSGTLRRTSFRLTDFDRLATIRLPLALSLLFLHNDRGGDFSGRMAASPALAEIVRIASVGIGGFRLPTFFLMAGYVFFRSVEPTTAWFGGKIASRARSLLLPLAAWNLLGLFCLGIARQIPFFASFLNAASGWGTPISEYTPAQFGAAIFGGLHSQPLIYPLWFLHDLFILVLFSPLIYGSIAASRGVATAAMTVLWLAGIGNPLVAPDALFFFFIGCHIALARKSLFSLDALGGIAAIGWLALQVVDADQVVGPLLGHQLKAIFGVIAVLALSGALARRKRVVGWAKRTEPYGFFVFFAHEPLLTVTRRASLKLLHLQSPTALLIAYFGVTLLVVMILVGVFMLVQRAAPRALAFMTGGRSSRALPAPRLEAVPLPAASTGLRSELDRPL